MHHALARYRAFVAGLLACTSLAVLPVASAPPRPGEDRSDRLDPDTLANPARFALRDWETNTLLEVPPGTSRDVRGYGFSAVLDGPALKLEASFSMGGTHMACEGRVLDLRGTADRAVDVVFSIPFAPASGVLWWPDVQGPVRVPETPLHDRGGGAPRTSFILPRGKVRRLRLRQPAGGGCAEKPNTLWIAEIEAYGRDLNRNILRDSTSAKVTCDSSQGKYSPERLTDGSRNDRFDPDWLNRGWASADTPEPHWVEMDLGAETELARFDVYWCRERFGFTTSRRFWLERWDGRQWRRIEAKISTDAPRLGDAEKSAFRSRNAGLYTETYPLACVTDGDGNGGMGIAIPPDSPCIYRIEYAPATGTLNLTFRFGLSPLPRNPALKSRAPFRFVLFPVDGKWGFRDAVRRYYELFPQTFRRVAKLDGLWLLGDLGKIPNPHHYAYGEHGEGNAELDALWGIYTCPYVLVGQREFTTDATDYETAMAAFAALDPSLRSFYGPALKEIIENCFTQKTDGERFLLLRRRGGSLKGPAVATFPMNPDPNLYAETDRRTVAGETLEHIEGIFSRNPGVDGIYVDSLSSWGAYKNARREHFEFADLPLTHDGQGRVVMDNALAHVEFLRALRKRLPSPDKVIFGNGIRKGRAWAGFSCDVLGVEASRSVHRDASHYAFFRTIARHKPFLLLYYYNYPQMDLPREAVSEYIQSAVAFGIAPETRPFGKERERDLDLYDTFIPVLRSLGQAGWEPVTHAAVDDAEVWLERFGTGPKGLFFTLYNPTKQAKRVAVDLDLQALARKPDPPVTERVTGHRLSARQLAALELPAKSLRVLQVGNAPPPPSPPKLSRQEVVGKLFAQRRKRWGAAGGLLANGGFEGTDAKSRPLGWRFASEAPGVVRIDPHHGRTGRRCVYILDPGNPAYAEVSQAFPLVNPDRKYEVSGWAKQAENASHPGRLYFQWRGMEGRIEQGRRDFPRTSRWARFAWKLEPPPGATTLHIALGCSRPESTELWLDDVSLTEHPR